MTNREDGFPYPPQASDASVMLVPKIICLDAYGRTRRPTIVEQHTATIFEHFHKEIELYRRVSSNPLFDELFPISLGRNRWIKRYLNPVNESTMALRGLSFYSVIDRPMHEGYFVLNSDEVGELSYRTRLPKIGAQTQEIHILPELDNDTIRRDLEKELGSLVRKLASGTSIQD